jgi:hypothetical protein
MATAFTKKILLTWGDLPAPPLDGSVDFMTQEQPFLDQLFADGKYERHVHVVDEHTRFRLFADQVSAESWITKFAQHVLESGRTDLTYQIVDA